MEYVILATCGVVVVLSLSLAAWCFFALRRLPQLLPSAFHRDHSAAISVIVPARNEEEDVVEALYSVLRQEGVDLEVIVVDDHSTDSTGVLVDGIAHADSRVTVLHAPTLQAGWLGKCNAMQHGAAKATGEYLLFSDADTVHAPACFVSALEAMDREAYDLLSLSPLWISRSFWEHVNIPIYFVGIAKFFGTRGLADPTSPNALASGAFMLTKADVFREIGGFESVKAEMFDDVGFARALKARGYRVGYGLAPECLQVRPYKNNREAFWGLTKNILGAVDGRAELALPLILAGVVQYWTPLLAIAIGIANGTPVLVWAGAGAYVIQYLSFFSVRRLLRFHPVKLLGFPLVVVVATTCIIRAVFHQTKGVIFWRGRAIKVK